MDERVNTGSNSKETVPVAGQNVASIMKDMPNESENIADRDENSDDCLEKEETEHPSPAISTLMAGDEYVLHHQEEESAVAITISDAMIPERPSSSPPELMGGGPDDVVTSSPSSGLLPSTLFHGSVSAITLDEAPGYLYLNTSGPSRRRANTGGSLGATRNQTETTASELRSRAESMGSMSLAAASSSSSSTSYDSSHKVPNECAICLTGYEVGETIVTSFDGQCPHAFHQECIVEWLVKMQDGAPCPCCRRTFIELDPHNPRGASVSRSGNTNNNYSTANNNNSGNNTANNASNNMQDPEEVERRRQERRRRRIENGIQRGSRTFNMGVISLR